MALRFIQKHIGVFGGDNKNILLFGESAGSASASFHLVSPMSKGIRDLLNLFIGVILI